MAGRLDSYNSVKSGDWEDAWNFSLEESEETGEYPPGSDESDDISSEQNDTNGILNGGEFSQNGRESPVHGLTPLTRPRELKLSHSNSERNSSLHRSSCSSVDLDSSGINGAGSLVQQLKQTSTSPAALNTLGGTEGELSEDTSLSPRLTPTSSNFDESQLISPSMGVAYHPHTRTLRIQNTSMRKASMNSSFEKRGGSMRKKKRSGSWYNVLSPSYKQKNEDFHKFFKDLPATERLLVDYACALVKDILVQGRLYVSQNYLCFHSTILKWQTAVTVNLVDVEQMTKEKTVKVIPNAIQVLMKDKTKMTFTSFTARDKAYIMIFRLFQNALLEKPMSADDLWSQIHRHYGEELGGCSSDDDYVRPKYMPRKHQSFGEVEGDLKYGYGSSGKTKKKKKSSNFTQTPPEFDKEDKNANKSSKSSSTRHSSQDSTPQFHADSTADDKSSHSSQSTQDDVSLPDDVIQEDNDFEQEEGRKILELEDAVILEDEDNDDPAEFVMKDLAKVSLNRTYETSAREMFRIIFGDDCSFWRDTLVNKGTFDIDFGTWCDDESVEGQKTRELSYTLRLDNPLGPKTSFVKEMQIYYACSVEGKSYAADCFAQNYGIPYGDYFHTCMRYCIRKVTKSTCELRITSELRYKKTPWGLVKNFIEKNVASGLTDNFRKLERQLLERIEYEKTQPQVERTRTRKNSNLRRRKRRSEASAGETQNRKGRHSLSGSPNIQGEGGDASPSDMNNNKSKGSTDDVTLGVPPLHPPNGFLPNQSSYLDSPKLHYFGQGGKFIVGAILFIFILLIYSNYTMYQRLSTLEQVTTAAATADGVDPSVTAALLDRPGVPITSNPEILSTYLQAIDKRLRRLEDTVLKFAESSTRKWEKMEKNWESLQSTIRTIAKQQGVEGG